MSDATRIVLESSGVDEIEPLRRIAALVASRAGLGCSFALRREAGALDTVVEQPAGGDGAPVSMPLVSGGEDLGVLTLFCPSSDDATVEFARALASRAAMAVRNARMAVALARQRTEFLTIASHELKTPLTPLSMQLQMLERQIARGQPAEPRLVQQARRHLSRLTALIEDLLDLSRMETGKLELRPEHVALDEIVAASVEEFRATATLHVISLERPDDHLIVAVDRMRIEQVVVNLIENAIKYSPLGGPIRVRVQATDGQAMVSVADEGIGIPREDQCRLFEPFFRAGNVAVRNFGGLGIGLFVSNEIVRRHGGEFNVQSEQARGSTFSFTLPLVERAVRAVGPRRGRILVVDDDPDIVDTAAQLLEEEGYVVDRARDGEEALQLARRTRPDVVLLDLMMPVLDGWGLMDRMRSERAAPGARVAVISADRQLAEKARELSADAALPKPFDLDQLLEVVRRLAEMAPSP